jgi:hypothetical protein
MYFEKFDSETLEMIKGELKIFNYNFSNLNGNSNGKRLKF